MTNPVWWAQAAIPEVWTYAGVMVARLVRIFLLLVMTFLAMGLVVAVARPEFGPFEKVVLGLAAVGVIAAAAPVRRIGRTR